MAERAILEQARQYDEVALGELYDRYAPRIYAYVYRQVGDAQLAEDLTGDVFVRVIQAIQSGLSVTLPARRSAQSTLPCHSRRCRGRKSAPAAIPGGHARG